MIAVGAASKKAEDKFAKDYRRFIKSGKAGYQAVNRVATRILLTSCAILRDKRPFADPNNPDWVAKQEALTKKKNRQVPMPEGTISQTEAAGKANVTRQAIHSAIKTGKLATVAHAGKQCIETTELERWMNERQKRRS